MTLAKLIPLALQSSIAILLFCIALKSSFRDITRLLDKPGLLGRSFLAMNVIMPLFAVMLALAFEFDNALEIAFIAWPSRPSHPSFPKGAQGGRHVLLHHGAARRHVAGFDRPGAGTVELLGRILDARPTYPRGRSQRSS